MASGLKNHEPEVHYFKIIEHPRHVEIPVLDESKIRTDLTQVANEVIRDVLSSKETIDLIRSLIKQAIQDATVDVHITNAIVHDREVEHHVVKNVPYEKFFPLEVAYDKFIPIEKEYTRWVAKDQENIRWVEKVKECELPVLKEKIYEVPKIKVVEEPYPVKVPKIEYDIQVMPKYVLREQTIWVKSEKIKGAEECPQ